MKTTKNHMKTIKAMSKPYEFIGKLGQGHQNHMKSTQPSRPNQNPYKFMESGSWSLDPSKTNSNENQEKKKAPSDDHPPNGNVIQISGNCELFEF